MSIIGRDKLMNGQKQGELCWLIDNYRFSGAPGEIRTPDPLVRSQVLYPTELRARM